ncbi:MAG: transglycosylase SLT domain-containing protein [Leptothrix sp. (in: b-proteobacteria)]
MSPSRSWNHLRLAASASARVFFTDLGQGLLAVGHNGLALFGLAVISGLILIGGRAEVRGALEAKALTWLLERQDARTSSVDDDVIETGDLSAVDRATAIDPAELNRKQAAVAQWLSRRYRVAPEPVSRIVQEAWSLGQRVDLEPTLILAIMAIESNFNPFAQSAVGAQGLMQVLTRVHDDKYEAFGGNHAAFDPLTNLRVGVQVLKDCIARAGSLEGGLRHYVGAANMDDDGGYAFKVLAEQEFMQQLLHGRSVPVTARLQVPPMPGASASGLAETRSAEPAPPNPPAASVQTTPKRPAPTEAKPRKTERLALAR